MPLVSVSEKKLERVPSVRVSDPETLCCCPAGSSWTSPRWFKYLILALIAYLSLSAYLADEMVAATATDLKTQLRIDTKQLGWLYSIGYGPNIIVIVVGGLLIDRLGVRLMTIVFTGIVFLGVAIFAIFPPYSAKLLGRFVFGIGLEPLEVCQDALLVRWFTETTSYHQHQNCAFHRRQTTEPSLSFALSVAFAVNIFGQLLGLVGLPPLVKALGDITPAYYIIAGACLTSLFVAAIVSALDKAKFRDPDSSGSTSCDQPQNETNLEEETSPEPKKSFAAAWLSRLRNLGAPFGVLMIITILSYSCQYVFMVFASDFLNEKWSMQPDVSGRYAAMVYGVALVGSPLVGILVHHTGNISTLIALGCSLFALASAMLAMIPATMSPLMPMLVMGIAYALVPTAVWCAVARIISDNERKSYAEGSEENDSHSASGFAFGIATATNSFGLLFIPYTVAWLHDTFPEYGYSAMCLLFSLSALITLIFVAHLTRLAPFLQLPAKEVEFSQLSFETPTDSTASSATSSSTSTPRLSIDFSDTMEDSVVVSFSTSPGSVASMAEGSLVTTPTK